MTPHSPSEGLTHVPVAPLGESQTTRCSPMDPILDLAGFAFFYLKILRRTKLNYWQLHVHLKPN